MTIKKITIIGGGNLGSAIANGILSKKIIEPAHLTVTRRNLDAINDLKEKGAITTSDNAYATQGADVVLLVVKPYLIEDVISEIKSVLTPNTIVISLATGTSSQEVEDWCGQALPIFRAMPNTATAIGESMTCMSARNTTKEQEQAVLDLFNNLGRALLIEESQMVAATVLASCGTAYALRYIRAAVEGGVQIGFKADVATELVAQTVKGAAELLLKNGNHPEVEIDRVTTPGGVTITGLNEMENQGLSKAVIQGHLKAFVK